jgi:hypothetical protein
LTSCPTPASKNRKFIDAIRIGQYHCEFVGRTSGVDNSVEYVLDEAGAFGPMLWSGFNALSPSELACPLWLILEIMLSKLARL